MIVTGNSIVYWYDLLIFECAAAKFVQLLWDKISGIECFHIHASFLALK